MEMEEPRCYPSTTSVRRGVSVFHFPIRTKPAMLHKYLEDAAAAPGEGGGALRFTLWQGTNAMGYGFMDLLSPARATTVAIVGTKGKAVGRIHVEVSVTQKHIPEPQQQQQAVVAAPPQPTIVSSLPLPPPAPVSTAKQVQLPPPQPHYQQPPSPVPARPPVPAVIGTTHSPAQLEDLYQRGLKLREDMNSAIHNAVVGGGSSGGVMSQPNRIPTKPLTPIHIEALLGPQQTISLHPREEDESNVLSDLSEYDEDRWSASEGSDKEEEENNRRRMHAASANNTNSNIHHYHGKWNFNLQVVECPQSIHGIRFVLRLSKDVVMVKHDLTRVAPPLPCTLSSVVTSYSTASAGVLEAWSVNPTTLLGLCTIPHILSHAACAGHGWTQHCLPLRDVTTASPNTKNIIVVGIKMEKIHHHHNHKQQQQQQRIEAQRFPVVSQIPPPPPPPPQPVITHNNGGIIINPESLVVGKVTRVEVSHTFLPSANTTDVVTSTTPANVPPPIEDKPKPTHIRNDSTLSPAPTSSLLLSPSSVPAVVGPTTLHQRMVRVAIEKLYHLPLVACRLNPENAVPPNVYVVVQGLHKSTVCDTATTSPELQYTCEILPNSPVVIDVYHAFKDQYLGTCLVDVKSLLKAHHKMSTMPIDGFYHIRTGTRCKEIVSFLFNKEPLFSSSPSSSTSFSTLAEVWEAFEGCPVLGQMKVKCELV
eukprot:PhF_6_TR30174/c0_g1_i3/m.44275